MVVGNGMKARRFMDYLSRDEYLIFAAGISNSTEKNLTLFDNEEKLITKSLIEYNNAMFVYFSTSSIYDAEMNNSLYVKHKLKMEKLISEKSKNYLIFRISQIVGISDNKNTVMNFLVDSILSAKEFNLWINAYRNFIDIDDVFFVINDILENQSFQNRIINIANPESVPIHNVVELIEWYFKKRGKYKLVEKGNNYHIDIEEIKPIIQKLEIPFGKDYINKLLEKYYPFRK